MAHIRKRKCLHCREFFTPDYRNIRRQKYCNKPCCRKASKAASQRKWVKKPENKDYFRGRTNVERVQEWRKNNPGYRRKKKPALQDICSLDIKENQIDNKLIPVALQDFCSAQSPVLLGLIANLTGSALQDDIYKTLCFMQQLGNDILNGSAFIKQGGQHDVKISHLSGACPKSPQTIQLGRPPSGT